METRDQYIELPTSRGDLRPTYHFMMKCLLYSRMETGLVSNQDFYDEDVNVYIAHLLDSMIQPEGVENARRFLSQRTLSTVSYPSKTCFNTTPRGSLEPTRSSSMAITSRSR